MSTFGRTVRIRDGLPRPSHVLHHARSTSDRWVLDVRRIGARRLARRGPPHETTIETTRAWIWVRPREDDWNDAKMIETTRGRWIDPARRARVDVARAVDVARRRAPTRGIARSTANAEARAMGDGRSFDACRVYENTRKSVQNTRKAHENTRKSVQTTRKAHETREKRARSPRARVRVVGDAVSDGRVRGAGLISFASRRARRGRRDRRARGDGRDRRARRTVCPIAGCVGERRTPRRTDPGDGARSGTHAR